MDLSFRLVNVFALEGVYFSGNPLAVFEDADGLTPEHMQALALQFNLSESTFLGRGDADVDAIVRIFTPTIELPFAGHPTVGTASVVGERLGRDTVRLRLGAGDIPVCRADNRWILTANPARVTPSTSKPVSRRSAAAMLGLEPVEVVADPAWVDSGIDQLLVQLDGPAAVRRANPDAARVRAGAMSVRGEALMLAWAWSGAESVEARFFFTQGSSLVEDPATGSAAANLGGLLAAQGSRATRFAISQGAALRRPSRLEVQIDTAGVVTVGGLVHDVGRGTVRLPATDRR